MNENRVIEEEFDNLVKIPEFKAWLETKDPEEVFSTLDTHSCPLTLYLHHLGVRKRAPGYLPEPWVNIIFVNNIDEGDHTTTKILIGNINQYLETGTVLLKAY